MGNPKIFPTWDLINSFKQPLLQQEISFIKYLYSNLSADWEVVVRPYLNADYPAIALLNKNVGLMIFDVIYWDEKYKHNSYPVKGSDGKFHTTHKYKLDGENVREVADPFYKVRSYRDNLINIYLPALGEYIHKKEISIAMIKLGLFFPFLTTTAARKLVEREKLCTTVGYDAIVNRKIPISELVPDCKIEKSYYPFFEWSENIRSLLIPPIHKLEMGLNLKLSPEQQSHAVSTPKVHQRLRGVAGSGKTLVLAQRAAAIASSGRKVLIVTYNITLFHYIQFHLNRAKLAFSREQIEIRHFHGFCSAYLRENDLRWPDQAKYESEDDFLQVKLPSYCISSMKSGHNIRNRSYDAILIDEGQDFYQAWYDLLCMFLSSNNELLLVVDEKQNIYQRDVSWLDNMRGTQFRGRWRELKKSYRIPEPILRQVNRFSTLFLPQVGAVPEIDTGEFDFPPNHIWRNVKTFTEAKEKTIAAIKWLLNKKRVKISEIVVLVSTHKEGWDIVGSLDKMGIEINHVFEDDLKSHKNKKSFVMDSEAIKLSTIHSFKGWELPNVILITPEGNRHDEQVAMLIYTSLTRTRQNLIVFNRHSKFAEFGLDWPNEWNG